MAWPGVENNRMLRAMLLKLSRASQLPYKAKNKTESRGTALFNYYVLFVLYYKQVKDKHLYQ